MNTMISNVRDTTNNACNLLPEAEAVHEPRLSNNNTFNASVLNESSLEGKSLEKYADRKAVKLSDISTTSTLV